eukprot:COSAG02_NODE_916_length_15971_cov_12.781061_16_plen_108_part_00
MPGLILDIVPSMTGRTWPYARCHGIILPHVAGEMAENHGNHGTSIMQPTVGIPTGSTLYDRTQKTRRTRTRGHASQFEHATLGIHAAARARPGDGGFPPSLARSHSL